MAKAPQEPEAEPAGEPEQAPAVEAAPEPEAEPAGGWYVSSLPLTLSSGQYVKAGETFYSEATPGKHWERTGPP